MLRFVENPRDRVAGFRLMQLMQGVGPTSAQRVLEHMTDGVPIRSRRSSMRLRRPVRATTGKHLWRP